MFYQVLLPSLRTIKSMLSSIEVGKDTHGMTITLFDKKFDSVCQALSRLKQATAFNKSQQNNVTRDLAIIVFTFYRVLYRDTAEQIYGNIQSGAWLEKDSYILLKRMPYKLMLFLGSQYWRLYELREVIYGDLRNLTLNHDIANLIIEGCQECLPELATILPESNNQENDDVELFKKFIVWLEQKIEGNDKRFQLNAGEWIFSSNLLYGDDVVFITESLLARYQNLHGENLDIMKNALAKMSVSHDTSYFLQHENARIDLIKVKGIKIKTHPINVVKIEEVQNGNKENSAA